MRLVSTAKVKMSLPRKISLNTNNVFSWKRFGKKEEGVLVQSGEKKLCWRFEAPYHCSVRPETHKSP